MRERAKGARARGKPGCHREGWEREKCELPWAERRDGGFGVVHFEQPGWKDLEFAISADAQGFFWAGQQPDLDPTPDDPPPAPAIQVGGGFNIPEATVARPTLPVGSVVAPPLHRGSPFVTMPGPSVPSRTSTRRSAWFPAPTRSVVTTPPVELIPPLGGRNLQAAPAVREVAAHKDLPGSPEEPQAAQHFAVQKPGGSDRRCQTEGCITSAVGSTPF
eukprot:gene34447-biopygen30176